MQRHPHPSHPTEYINTVSAHVWTLTGWCLAEKNVQESQRSNLDMIFIYFPNLGPKVGAVWPSSPVEREKERLIWSHTEHFMTIHPVITGVKVRLTDPSSNVTNVIKMRYYVNLKKATGNIWNVLPFFPINLLQLWRSQKKAEKKPGERDTTVFSNK